MKRFKQHLNELVGTPSSRLDTKGQVAKGTPSSRLDTKGFTPQKKSSSSASRGRPAAAPRKPDEPQRTSASATRNANKGRTNAPERGAERKATQRKAAKDIGLLRKSSGPATRGGERAKQYRGTDKEGSKTPLKPNMRKTAPDMAKQRRLSTKGFGATDGAVDRYRKKSHAADQAIMTGKAADFNKAYPGQKKQVGDRPDRRAPDAEWKKWWKANGRGPDGKRLSNTGHMGFTSKPPRYNTD